MVRKLIRRCNRLHVLYSILSNLILILKNICYIHSSEKLTIRNDGTSKFIDER